MPDQWNGDFNLTPVDKPWRGKFDLLPAPRDEGPEDPAAADKFIGPVDDRSLTTKVMDQIHATARNHPYITGILQDLIGGPEATPAGQKIMQEKGITGIEGPRLTPMPGVKQVADYVKNKGINTGNYWGGYVGDVASQLIDLLEGGGDPRALAIKGDLPNINAEKELGSQLGKLKIPPANSTVEEAIRPTIKANRPVDVKLVVPESKPGEPPFDTAQFGLSRQNGEGLPYPLNVVPNRLRPPSTNATVFNALLPDSLKTNAQGAFLKPTEELVKPQIIETPREMPSASKVASEYEATKGTIDPDAERLAGLEAQKAAPKQNIITSEKGAVGDQSGPQNLKELQESQGEPSKLSKLVNDETGALILRGFKKPQVDELRSKILTDLASSDKIDLASMREKYGQVVSKSQFDKIIDDINSTGDLAKLMQANAARDQAAASLPAPRDTQEAIERLLGNIQDHIIARKEQDALVSAEKRARIQNAMAVKTPGMEGFYSQLRELQGKYPKVDVPTLQSGLNPQDIQNVRQAILNHPELTDWQKINAQHAFAKAIGKSSIEGALQPGEIQLLQKIFGSQATDQLVYLNGAIGGVPNPGMATQAFNKALNIAGQAKGLKFGGDIGWPFRQGMNYALSPTWFKNTFKSIPSFFSENFAKRAVSEIKHAPDYEDWIKSGLNITDFTGHTLREESFPVDIAPGLRKYFGINAALWPSDASNRAMVVGLDGMRIDKARQLKLAYENLYTSMMKDAAKASDPAIGADLKNAAERYNTNNPQAMKDIADWVNTATGRGELPDWMRGSEKMLNHLLSSPRLVSSRLRTFNRVFNFFNYPSVPAPMRKDAIKQLLSISTVMGTTLGLMKEFRGSTINDNPTSSDFLRAREGRTRLDPSGSLLGYVYPAARLYYGASTVGDDQNVKRLNSFGQPTGTEVVMNTLAGNRLSPVASLASAIFNHAEFGGKPNNWTSMNPMENTLTRTMGFPVVGNLFMQDLYDVFYENPELQPLDRLGKTATYAGPDWLGMGVNTYQPREKQTPKPKLSLKTTSIGPFHLTVPSE